MHWYGKPEEEMDQQSQSEASEVEAIEDKSDAVTAANMDNDDVLYEFDSDDEIVWKDD
jgi:hypothetical protein